MKETLPQHFQNFVKEYPEVWEAHQQMAQACAKCGPLDRKTRELIKVAIAATANQETAVERHCVMAAQEGATCDEIYQTVLLMITTVGFPRASAAMKWAKQALSGV